MVWATASTAHSCPQPGTLACQSLRDILSRWGAGWPPPEDPASPVVHPDRVVHGAIAALESLGVVASEALQHRTLAEVTRTLAIPSCWSACLGASDLQAQVEDVAPRSLSALGEQVPTREPQEALRRVGFDTSAEAVHRAAAELGQSIGLLDSRSTRVPRTG